MASQDTLNQINGLLGQYQQMAPTNVGDIQHQFMQRVANFQPQYNELANAEKNAYTAPANVMAQYQQQYGNDNGPDMFTRIGNAMNQIGTKMGTANAIGNGISAAQGRIGDLANTTLGQYNAMRQGLMDQVNPLQNIYGSQLQSELQNRQLSIQQQLADAQRQLYANMMGGGQGGQVQGAQTGGNGLTINTEPPGIMGLQGGNVGSATLVPGIARGLGMMSPMSYANPIYHQLTGQNLAPLTTGIRAMGGGGLVDALKNSFLADPLKRFGDVFNGFVGYNSLPGYLPAQ